MYKNVYFVKENLQEKKEDNFLMGHWTIYINKK